MYFVLIPCRSPHLTCCWVLRCGSLGTRHLRGSCVTCFKRCNDSRQKACTRDFFLLKVRLVIYLARLWGICSIEIHLVHFGLRNVNNLTLCSCYFNCCSCYFCWGSCYFLYYSCNLYIYLILHIHVNCSFLYVFLYIF